MIDTLVGFWWLDIACTDNADALYHGQVEGIDNLAHSFLTLFKNLVHLIAKSDFVCIQVYYGASSGSVSVG